MVATAETERFSATVVEPIVRLHPAERETRRGVLAKCLTGFELKGESDPSARLCVDFSTIMATGLVRYIT